MKSNKFLIIVFVIGLAFTLGGLTLVRMEITSTAMGVVQYKEETVVFAPIQAQIEQVLVTPNQFIQAGDTILRLGNPDLELQINQTEIDLFKAKRAFKQAELDLAQEDITGKIPELQNIQEILRVQKEYARLSNLLEENNEVSLEQNLISRKQYYLEGMAHLKHQMSLIENEQLNSWKEKGLESIHGEMGVNALQHIELQVSQLEKRLALLKQEAAKLDIVAPHDGIVVDYYFDYKNELISQGEKVLKFANPRSGFQVKSYIPEKNIDLISMGMKARMESRVFHSQLEGYLHGEVVQLINSRDVNRPEDTQIAFYEVLVDVQDYPYPPVHGSRVELEIIIGRGSVIAALLNRPSVNREPLSLAASEY